VRATPAPFHSTLLTFLRGHTDVLQRLVTEMYARGLSTRDIEDAFRDITGHCLISASAVSELTDRLWEDYEAFTKRDLSGFAVEYLFLDAIYESLRLQGGPAEGCCAPGRSLQTAPRCCSTCGWAKGNKESYEAWLALLRDMVRRGLRIPVSITSDGAPGLMRAVEDVWPKSLRLRCWVHKMRNVLDKVPEAARAEVKAHLITVRDAPTYAAGQQAVQATLARWKREFPAAMSALAEDLEASLAHLKLPIAHRKHARTTNLIERSFLEERRRTKIIPRFFDERSCLKLVYATLVRASQRWYRIPMTDHHREQLRELRQHLGISVLRHATPSQVAIRRVKKVK